MNGVVTRIEAGKAELGQNPSRHYLWIPVEKKWVEMMEALPYEPLQVLNVTVSQKANHFYVSFNMKVKREDFYNAHSPNEAHRGALGLDWGVSSKVTIASGDGAIKVAPFKGAKRYERLLKRRQRNLDRKIHPRTKDDVQNNVVPSKSYNKAAKKLAALQRKIAARRIDHERKLVSAIVRYASVIGMEDPNVAGLLRNHHLAKAISNVSPGRFLRRIEWVAEWRSAHVTRADPFFASTQTCSKCGAVRKKKLELKDRVFQCEACGDEMDRDHNAAAVLLQLALAEVEALAPVQEDTKRAGEANTMVLYKTKAADLEALKRRLERDGLETAGAMKEAVKKIPNLELE